MSKTPYEIRLELLTLAKEGSIGEASQGAI